MGDIRYIRQSELRTAASNWQGRNRTGYVNPELEALADRFETNPTAVANRLTNVDGKSREAPVSWNAHEWDVN